MASRGMTERTPLRAAATPQYVFGADRLYRNKVRQFQCCVCATVLACFVVAIVATVAYSVDRNTEDGRNSNTLDNMSAQNVLMSLPVLQYPLLEQDNITWNGEMPSVAQLEEALNIGHTGLQDRDQLEVAGVHLEMNSPSYRHQMAMRTRPEATRLARAGYVLNLATRHLANSMLRRRNNSREPVGRGPSVEADWMPPEACADASTSPCLPTPFQSADGSCNNLLHPLKWGVALRPFRRILPPDYADGVMAPRAASDGDALPSAREVSITLHRPIYRDDPKFTVMLAVWGQFIDHDITATALSTGKDGSAISCCGMKPNHPECFPIQLSAADQDFNVSCAEFVRSAPAPTCSLGPREQLNQVSAYLDGSMVYGASLNLTAQLRSMRGGRLHMSVTPDGRTLLPYSVDASDGCNRKEQNVQGRYCFLSGDARANENLHLTTMHLLWARQHNLVADRLQDLNPSWDDERVFQEARHIVTAQLQHITYSEFLPVLLGDELMSRLDLNPQPSGYFHGYSSAVDASIANSFATAAFRFGHTLLPGLMKVPSNNTEEYVELHRMLFNPYGLYVPGHLDSVLRGALDTHVEKVDPYFTNEVTGHLFEQPIPSAGPHGRARGLDLVSLNIQRGRDHGLPTYTAWRERCGLSHPGNFSDMSDFIDEKSLEKMTELYRSVDDIDLYTGALAEQPLEGGFLGPTLLCLITDQFVRLKRGDRFWYETPEVPQAFTPGQLAELRRTSLARIICDNADSVHKAQPLVMHTTGPGNERVPCSSIPGPDFSLWQEEGLHHLKLGSLGTGVRVLSTRLGAHVPSGYVVSDTGAVLWDGQTPVPLPVDFSFRPLWAGTLTGDSLSGIFSQQQNSQQWVNGRFFFQISTDWFQSHPSEMSGVFTSPIYFKEVEQFEVPASQPPSAELPQNKSTPSVQATSLPPTAPIVLEGAYSGSGLILFKHFLYPGYLLGLFKPEDGVHSTTNFCQATVLHPIRGSHSTDHEEDVTLGSMVEAGDVLAEHGLHH